MNDICLIVGKIIVYALLGVGVVSLTFTICWGIIAGCVAYYKHWKEWVLLKLLFKNHGMTKTEKRAINITTFESLNIDCSDNKKEIVLEWLEKVQENYANRLKRK
jgi:hypothetical protein